MEMFDLVDIQRVRHPKLRNSHTIQSFEFKIQNRLFPNSSRPHREYKKVRNLTSDHNAIYISLALSNKCPRGPGFWKFINTLLNDPQYIDKIRYTYTRLANIIAI